MKEAIKLLNSKKEFIVVALGNVSNQTEPNNFVYRSGIHDEKLMALMYSAADVCVIASREDNLPNVMIEALSCGTPVIGFPIGGIPETVLNNKNGILCDNLSPNSLAKAIDQCFDGEPFDPKLIRDLAVARFNLRVQARNYSNVYQGVIDRFYNGNNNEK